MNKLITAAICLLSLTFASLAQAGAYRIPPNEVTAEQLQLPPTIKRALYVCTDGSLDVGRCKSTTLIDITGMQPEQFDTDKKRAAIVAKQHKKKTPSCGNKPTACNNVTETGARVPDVPYVFPTDAPNLVESVFFISSLKGDVLTQIVSTNDKEKGPYFFLMTPPVGSKVLVDLENILLCLQKINPFAIGSNQGVYIKNPLGQWNYVGLNIADTKLEYTPYIEHRCD